MEYVNKVEIVGTIGNIKANEIGGGLSKVINMSVVTSYVYKDRNEVLTVVNDWHSVTAWESREIPNVDIFQHGMNVRIIGRLKTRKYTDANGIERYVTEVNAKTIEVLDKEPLSLPR